MNPFQIWTGIRLNIVFSLFLLSTAFTFSGDPPFDTRHVYADDNLFNTEIAEQRLVTRPPDYMFAHSVSVSMQELMTSPKSYIGKIVKLRGKITDIQDIEVDAGHSYNDSISETDVTLLRKPHTAKSLLFECRGRLGDGQHYNRWMYAPSIKEDAIVTVVGYFMGKERDSYRVFYHGLWMFRFYDTGYLVVGNYIK